MFNIIDMDLKIPVSDFEKQIDDLAQEYEDDCGIAVEPIISPATTRQGKQLYKIVFVNNSLSGYEFTIYATQGHNGVVEFSPLIVDGNPCCSNSLLDPTQEGKDNDMANFARKALPEIFKESKGTLVYKDDIGYSMIKRGSTGTKCFEAVVDSAGNVYSPIGKAFTVDPNKFTGGSGSDEDDDLSASKSTGVPITILLQNWSKQSPEAASILQKSISQAEKMDEIGLLLIEKRLKEEIDSKDFKSLYYQASIYGFSGTNQQIEMMSKLILDEIEVV